MGLFFKKCLVTSVLAVASVSALAGAAEGDANIDATANANANSKVQRQMVIVPELGNTSFHVTGLNSNYRSANLIGAKLRFPMENKRLSYSVGVQYFQAGFKQRIEFGILSMNVAEISTDYLAVPLVAEFLMSQPEGEGTKYFLSGSLTPAYLLSARFTNLLESGSKEKGIRSEMNGLDVLGGIGLGARYATAIGTLEAAIDYQRGFRDVVKDQSSKNEGFVARIGYHVAL